MLPPAQPKPRRQASVKARNTREEAKLKRVVRAACVARDGVCRIYSGWLLHGDPVDRRGMPICGGDSQWAHLEDHRRFKTRGMPAEQRHTTAGSCMLCENHHAMYDTEKSLTVRFLSELGADGPLAWERK